MSQLDLAAEADVSARHLSFVETGRSRPSRELVLHLAEHLDVPQRDRNTLLMAAGDKGTRELIAMQRKILGDVVLKKPKVPGSPSIA